MQDKNSTLDIRYRSCPCLTISTEMFQGPKSMLCFGGRGHLAAGKLIILQEVQYAFDHNVFSDSHIVGQSFAKYPSKGKCL